MASGNSLFAFLPQHGEPPASNYATLNTRNGICVAEFDTTTQETLIFRGVMPLHYGGGGITVYVQSMMASATSGTVGWDVTFERDNDANHDLDSDGFATAQTVTAATVDGTSGKLLTLNVAITAGAAGTDSLAAGEPFRLRLRRDVANDSAAGDAQLVAIHGKET